MTDRETLLILEELLDSRRKSAAALADSGFPAESNADVREIESIIEKLRARTAAQPPPQEAAARAVTSPPPDVLARGPQLSIADLSKLRDHVVNLDQGFFSDDGQFTTSEADVDRIFEGVLRTKLDEGNLHLLFFAHGGLVDEAAGLQGALRQVDWWVNNGVYPIFFVWETGIWNTIEHLLTGVQQRALTAGARDFFDFTSDPVVESLARIAGGPAVWGGMKRSAEMASNPGGNGHPQGGGFYVARKLKELCDRAPEKIELHAVGHSAGAIFHAYFLPAALSLGVPEFKTLQFLAPAINVDAFKLTLFSAPSGIKGAERLVMYSMKQDLEKADNCANVYHKSLLYLIYYALESRRKTPILGLEECVWRDADLKKLFGLSGGDHPHADSVWSRTEALSGRNASRSTSHGGFDDDRATMESVLRQVLGKSDTDPIIANPNLTDGGRSLALKQPSIAARFAATAAVESGGVSVPAFQPGIAAATTGGKRRRAVCVGINSYASQPLFGCVSDANLWAGTLRALGFDVQLLLEANATYTGMKSALQNLISSSSAGDVIVFQYAGHGTSIPKDEGEPDEAIVPIDFFTSGALLLDKEIADIFSKTPAGVNLTTFFDSCNSGDIDRLLLGQSTSRARFLHLTPAQLEHYHQFAQSRSLAQLPARAARGDQRDVTFAACRRDESAFESNGQGDFTGHATGLLRQSPLKTTNREFFTNITASFGSNARQHPQLLGSPGLFGLPLLEPLTGAAPAQTPAQAPAPQTNPAGGDPLRVLAQGFRQLAEYLEKNAG